MKLSIIVPSRNEKRHIRRFLANLRQLEAPRDGDYEILIAEGRSDDGTREILEAERYSFPQLNIHDNPRQSIAPGLNRAIRQARGEIIVRLDVHTRYAPDYLLECIRALEEIGADNVGGPWVAEGSCGNSRAIALAFRSAFVSGGGKAHDPEYEGWVDTVYLGCWKRETLARLGLFDETMVRAQDSELNLRTIRLGGRIWQTPRIRSWYKPRSRYRDLFRQYVQYGYWKVVTLRRHRLPASIRQLVPPLFLLGLAGTLAAAPWSPPAGLIAKALVASYLVLSLIAAAGLCSAPQNRSLFPRVLAAIPTYHFGFGLGYLRGILDQFILSLDKPTSDRVRLTRGRPEKSLRSSRTP